MGLFFRKSFRIGPLRFNFSKSGLGVSAGIKGAHVGIGPKGRPYVTAGRDGIYFRERLSDASDRRISLRKLGLVIIGAAVGVMIVGVVLLALSLLS